MTATREIFGFASRRSCSRFAATSVLLFVSPVTLPPGRANEATTSIATGSATSTKSIGVVDVACFAATVAAEKTVTRRSGWLRRRSFASPGNSLNSASRVSITMFLFKFEKWPQRDSCAVGASDLSGVGSGTVGGADCKPDCNLSYLQQALRSSDGEKEKTNEHDTKLR